MQVEVGHKLWTKFVRQITLCVTLIMLFFINTCDDL